MKVSFQQGSFIFLWLTYKDLLLHEHLVYDRLGTTLYMYFYDIIPVKVLRRGTCFIKSHILKNHVFKHYAILLFKAQKEEKHQGIAKDVETRDQEY